MSSSDDVYGGGAGGASSSDGLGTGGDRAGGVGAAARAAQAYLVQERDGGEILRTKTSNPQLMVEAILRQKIYNCRYWKEKCFGITAEVLVDRAVELRYVGGTFGGNTRPTPFICLVLKMLQLQPERDIVFGFIDNSEYKYVRALGLFYLRLVGEPVEIFQRLEAHYADWRPMRLRSSAGWQAIHVDEFVDKLLTSEFYCDIVMPRIPSRMALEAQGLLLPRVSPLQGELEGLDLDGLDSEDGDGGAVSPHGGGGGGGGGSGDSGDDRWRGSDRSDSGGDSRDRRKEKGKKKGKKKKKDKKKKKKKKKREKWMVSSESADGAGGGGGSRSSRKKEEGEIMEATGGRDRHGTDKEGKDKGGKDAKVGSKRKREDDIDQEIAEANALRASLGLPLLRP